MEMMEGSPRRMLRGVGGGEGGRGGEGGGHRVRVRVRVRVRESREERGSWCSTCRDCLVFVVGLLTKSWVC